MLLLPAVNYSNAWIDVIRNYWKIDLIKFYHVTLYAMYMWGIQIGN